MDYLIWNSLKEKVNRGQKDKFKEQELKDRIVASWEEYVKMKSIKAFQDGKMSTIGGRRGWRTH